jgi:deazaflavin-dependent oxidoreductase (nitroreductase family)
MRKRSGIAAAAVIVPAAAVAAVVLGIRSKYPPVVNAVRRFARDTGNPQVMKRAGTPGGPASIIRHTGRSSGRSFETPVTPFQSDDGFLIALPYGPGTDWVKNILAAGSATLVHEGATYPVDRPEIVPSSEAVQVFGARERFLSLFGVTEVLRLHHAAPAA